MTAKAATATTAAESVKPVWRIELLGGVCLRHRERVLQNFKTRRITLLLTRLACFPDRAHPRDTLAEELWPDEAPDTLRERFRQTLSMLRRELEPEGFAPGSVLIADRSNVRLAPDAFSTDVAEFADFCRAAREETPARQIELLRQAEALYRGELLPGFYEDWIQTEREHLAELHRQALNRLTEAYAALGQWESAIEAARKAVTSNLLSEDSHCTLIRVFALSGRVADARRHFEELEQLLRAEFDSEPSPATYALMAQVRAGTLVAPVLVESRITPTPADNSVTPSVPPSSVAPPLAPAPPLPTSLTRFFGREEEIANLVSLLPPGLGSASAPLPSTLNPQPLQSPPPFVTLTGPGGAGKTRLALEVARRLSPDYSGAVWFVPLADVAHPDLIADALVEMLGLARSAHAAPLDQAIEFLRPYPAALLVLDNFEHLQEEGTHFVQELRQRLPRLSCLVTSRHKLNVYGERDIALPRLQTPDMSETPEALLAYPSVQLFLDRAQAARYSFQLTGDNAAAVATLGQRLEGLPLAIELAAAWAATLAPEQILARLSRRFDLLVSRRRDVPPRHQSLQAVLEGSYQLLPPRLQRLYARLSVFRGGWTLESAEAIAKEERGRRKEEASAAPLPPSSFLLHPLSVLDGLAVLQERSFVVAEERGAEMRYRLLESLREFGAEQLEPEEKSNLSRSHAEYFLALTETAQSKQRTPEEKKWFDRLETETENIRAAMEWALQNDADISLQMPSRLCGFWMTRGLAREGNEWLQKALSADVGELGTAHNEQREERAQDYGKTRKQIRADALNSFALMKLSLGEYDAGKELAREALAILRQLEAKTGMARALNTLGAILMEQGNYHEAQSCYEECLNLYRALNNRLGESIVLANLGNLVYGRGEYALACAYYSECLQARRALGDKRGIAAALDYLGRALREQGDYARACDLHSESLVMRRELNDKESLVLSLNHLGTVKAYMGEQEEARRLHEESMTVAQETGDKGSMAEALSHLGELARLSGEEHTARDYYAQSLAISQELGDRANLAGSLESFAGLARPTEQFHSAAQMMGAADAIRSEISSPIRPSQRPHYEQTITAVREALGEARFEQAWAEGRALTLEQALRLTK